MTQHFQEPLFFLVGVFSCSVNLFGACSAQAILQTSAELYKDTSSDYPKYY